MKYRSLFISLLILLSLFGCKSKDRFIPDEMNIVKDASLGVRKIEIEGIEKVYYLPSLGTLTINPKITSDYAEEDLTYEWIISPEERWIDSTSKKKFKAHRIGAQKDLKAPLTFSSGSYNAYLKVTSESTGVSAFMSFKVEIARVNGFFALKETSSGETDIDFYALAEQDKPSSVGLDLYKTATGEHLKGKPRNFDILYQQSFLDPDSLTNGKEIPTKGNTFFITTDEEDNHFIRYSDFKEVQKTDQRFYFEDHKTHTHYSRAIRGYFHTVLFTNQGIFATYNGSWGNYRGTMGYPLPNTDRKTLQEHIFVDLGEPSFSAYYWDPNKREIVRLILTADPPAIDESITSKVKNYPLTQIPYNPIFGGSFKESGTNKGITVIVFDDPGRKERILYRFSQSQMDSVQVFDNSSTIGRSTRYAINSGMSITSAPVLYCLTNDNKLYIHNLWNNTPDRQIHPEGLPEGEKITYISCEYYIDPNSEASIDYLLIGTQQESGYKVYMYTTIGGVPNGSPVHTFEGTGVLKKVVYASPSFDKQAKFSITDSYAL